MAQVTQPTARPEAPPRPSAKDKLNPKWAKSSMSLQQAANQAYHRGSILKVSWSPEFGLRVIAEQVREIKERERD